MTTSRWMAAAGLCLVACTGQVGGDGAHAGNGAQPAGGAGGPGAQEPLSQHEGPFIASASVARRLTRDELDHTVRDLIGDAEHPARTLLAEDPFSPFDNEYTQQVASGALIDGLSVLARDVAARLLADPARRALVITCEPTGAGDADCFREVIEGLGPRALRRPLRPEEVEAYLTLLRFASEQVTGLETGFDTAVGLFIEALLQDPEFLYRIEVGSPVGPAGVFTLTEHEVATRMAFLLWGSTPGDDLRAAAGAGELLDSASRRQHAQGMLDDPRAREQLQRFHAMWLGYRAIPHGPELAAAFQRETSALLDRVIFEEDLSYLEAFTLDETYLDEMLAEHYGLPAPEGGEGWVPYGDSGRAGLLSHGSFLSAFGKFSDTSPTQRGILIRTRLMCEALMPPPANINADEPPGGMDATACKYERYEAHRSSGACAACHAQMDPIGFGLENYDLAGRFRMHDEGMPECVIDGQGSLPPHGDFRGPAELARMLVQEDEIDDCVVRQLFSYAIGRAPEGNESEAIDGLIAGFRSDGHSVRSLLLDYVAAEAFTLRLEPSTSEEDN